MLVLLPPSEGKADPERGPALDLDALSIPELTDAREAVLEALITLCSGHGNENENGDGRGDGDYEDRAAKVLGLGLRQRGEVARNARLRSAPTRPAAEIYTGVLYDALDLESLPASARRRADRSLLVFSGLWGALRPGDPIPAYRCSGGVRLPGLGALGPHWRQRMATVLPAVAGDGLVLDLRSTGYAGMWRPQGELARRTVTLRVLHSRWVDGVEKRTVVSHFNKATKGRLVRALLTEGAEPASPAELADALRALGHTVEAADAPTGPGAVARLDVVVSEV